MNEDLEDESSSDESSDPSKELDRENAAHESRLLKFQEAKKTIMQLADESILEAWTVCDKTNKNHYNTNMNDHTTPNNDHTAHNTHNNDKNTHNNPY